MSCKTGTYTFLKALSDNVCIILIKVHYDYLKIMAYFCFILVGFFCSVATKGITKDDMEKKFVALVDRIELLEHTVHNQNRVIQSHQDNMASMQKAIRTQANKTKSQSESITHLQDITRTLQSGVKRQDKCVKTLEKMVNDHETFISVVSAQLQTTKMTIDPYETNGNRTEYQEMERFNEKVSGSYNNELENSTESKSKTGVYKTGKNRLLSW